MMLSKLVSVVSKENLKEDVGPVVEADFFMDYLSAKSL